MHFNAASGSITLWGLVNHNPPRRTIRDALGKMGEPVPKRQFLDDGQTISVGERLYRHWTWEDCIGRRDVWRDEERLITVAFVDDEQVVFYAPGYCGHMPGSVGSGTYYRWMKRQNVLECNCYPAAQDGGTAFFVTKPSCRAVPQDLAKSFPIEDGPFDNLETVDGVPLTKEEVEEQLLSRLRSPQIVHRAC